MAELSGFSAVAKISVDLGPQSMRVPTGKEDAITKASQIFEGLWDAVEAGLSPNVTIEILKHTPPDGPAVTYCRITPWQAGGVAKTVANPGDLLAIDGTRLLGMTPETYAAHFTPPDDQPET